MAESEQGTPRWKLLASLSSAAVLAACGGGGGSPQEQRQPAASGPYVVSTAPGTAVLLAFKSVEGDQTEVTDLRADTVLADDGRALVRLAVQAREAGGSTRGREFFVSRTREGRWLPAERFENILGSPGETPLEHGRMFASPSGWVAFQQSRPAEEYRFSAAQALGTGDVGARLRAAPQLTVGPRDGFARVSATSVIGNDGIQYVTDTLYRDEYRNGWNLALRTFARDGSTGPVRTLHAEAGTGHDQPHFSDGSLPGAASLFWFGPGPQLYVAAASLEAGTVKPPLPTGVAGASRCTGANAYRTGAITVTLWWEALGAPRDPSFSCRLHATVIDERAPTARVSDAVLSRPDVPLAGSAWASVSATGELMVLWRHSNSQNVFVSSTQLPDPNAAQHEVSWSALSRLTGGSGQGSLSDKLGSSDFLSSVVKVGPAGHVAVAYRRAALPVDGGTMLAARLYTPGQGWSTEKPIAYGPGSFSVQADNLAVSTQGKLLVNYLVDHYCAERRYACGPDKYLMGVALD